MITSLRRPGRIAMTLTIVIGPSGVRASKDPRRTWRPARVSSSTMYRRARASAAEPRRAEQAREPAAAQGFGVQTPDDAVEDAGRELAVRMLQRKRPEILVLRAHDSAAPGHPDHLAEHRRRLVHVEEDRHGERD